MDKITQEHIKSDFTMHQRNLNVDRKWNSVPFLHINFMHFRQHFSYNIQLRAIPMAKDRNRTIKGIKMKVIRQSVNYAQQLLFLKVMAPTSSQTTPPNQPQCMREWKGMPQTQHHSYLQTAQVMCWQPEAFSNGLLHLGHLFTLPSAPSPILSQSKPFSRVASSHVYPKWLCRLHSLQKVPAQVGHTRSSDFLPLKSFLLPALATISYTPSQLGQGHCLRLPQL